MGSAPFANRVILLLTLCFSLQLLASAAQADEIEARTRILVKFFDAPGLPDGTGVSVSEIVSAALTRGGMVEVVRPTQVEDPWFDWANNVWVNDVRPVPGGGTVSLQPPALSTAGVRTIQTGGLNMQYILEGGVARAEDVWTIRVTLRDAIMGTVVDTQSVAAPREGDLPAAAGALARALSPVWANALLERRCIALRQSMAKGDLAGDEAEKQLKEWVAQYPDSYPPLVLLFKIAPEQRGLKISEEQLERARKLRDMLPAGGAPMRRFMIVCDADPFSVLADDAAMRGDQKQALELHREAAAALPVASYEHYVEAAQAAILRRDYPVALEASEQARALQPDNGYANLLYAILLQRTGKKQEAVTVLKAFLEAHPEDEAAGQIKTQIAILEQ